MNCRHLLPLMRRHHVLRKRLRVLEAAPARVADVARLVRLHSCTHIIIATIIKISYITPFYYYYHYYHYYDYHYFYHYLLSLLLVV